ncbi:hypothetical protein AALP_AA8G300000 [Arabis alpina]|uniref:LTI65/LTI78 N-terminal domain-containing protein n=1 Tax=Arabis alpina TaxID=50452 RepID=A0A087GAD3_ARAAL|nr:hypothetical protein AALP_AA8G300000 [Arabis alpina]
MDITPTRPSGQDQQEDPIKIQHPEEEEHNESGASKMFKRVKAKAKKIKNTLTKHDNEHDQDVDEEDDEVDEQVQAVHNHPAYESSAARGVTGQPESLSHPRETKFPEREDIISPGKNVFSDVSSDNNKPIEPELLQDATNGHDARSYPVTSEMEEKRDALSHPLADREESREVHHVRTDTHVPFLSETEDVTRKFTPDEDEYLGGQQEVNVEIPKRSEEERSGVSNDQANVSSVFNLGGGVPEIDESFGNLKVTDEGSGQGFERDLPMRSQESDMETETGIGKDSPARSGEFDMETEAGILKDSPSRYGGQESGAELGKDVPITSYESGTGEDLPTGFGGESGAGKREEFLAKSLEFNQEIGSGIGKDPLTELPEDMPERCHELGLKEDSGIGKDSPMGDHGYGEESEAGVEKIFPVRSDDVKVETELGRELPTGTHDQYSTELSRPKERDDFDSSVEVKRDETQETEHITYAEQIGSATKNALASGLGYSEETTRAGGQHESHMGVETPEHKVGETVDEKFTPVDVENVKEAESTETTKLPISGGGSGLVEEKDVLATENVRPGEEDKALWGKLKEEREQGEAAAVEEKAGVGMVGKIKGAYNYFLGGTTEEVKPKSPTSVEESSQSLGSTVGTTGFPDSGESGLGETGGAVPVGKGL